MSTTQPIRTKEDLSKLEHYFDGNSYLERRNYLLIIMGLNTALRVTDMLKLRWSMVYDFKCRRQKTHIELTEQKTGKKTRIAMNNTLKEALNNWMALKKPSKNDFIFESSRGKNAIDRHQAYRIIRSAADACGLPDHISCHSLRKTFGYQAWRKGIPPALLMNIFNHSSFRITSRYLCIDQDDKDDVFRQMEL